MIIFVISLFYIYGKSAAQTAPALALAALQQAALIHFDELASYLPDLDAQTAVRDFIREQL